MAGIDLNLLRIFDAVMTERNVTRASNTLHITQPAVSNALNRLRDVLDDPLFVRTHGGVNPTHKAQLIWPIVRDALSKLNSVLETDTFDPATSQADFRLAMSEYLAGRTLGPLLHARLGHAPGVKVHLRPFTLETAALQLERGEIDLAAGVYSVPSPSLRSQPFETLSFVLVMCKNHRLLRQDAISLDDFLNARHLAVNIFGTPGAPPLVDKELHAAGLHRNICFTVNQFSLLPEMLANSDLVAIIPAAVAFDSAYSESLAVVDTPFEFERRALSLIWHERTDSLSAHQWLRSEVLAALQSHGRSARRAAADPLLAAMREAGSGRASTAALASAAPDCSVICEGDRRAPPRSR